MDCRAKNKGRDAVSAAASDYSDCSAAHDQFQAVKRVITLGGSMIDERPGF
jgi:hypothetical protein